MVKIAIPIATDTLHRHFEHKHAIVCLNIKNILTRLTLIAESINQRFIVTNHSYKSALQY